METHDDISAAVLPRVKAELPRHVEDIGGDPLFMLRLARDAGDLGEIPPEKFGLQPFDCLRHVRLPFSLD